MRKQFISAISLRILLATCSLGPVSNAVASPLHPDWLIARSTSGPDSLALVQPEIKYLGYNEDYYFFELQVSNPAASRVSILLTDKYTRNTLFSEVFEDTSYLKKVAVPKENLELQWDFTNKSIKGKTNQRTLSLGTTVRFKDEVKVTRL